MKSQALLFKKLLVFVFVSLMSFTLKAQVGAAINTSGASPDPSAMLDVSSTTSGVLVPRMTESDRLSIASPARGLLIYEIDQTPGFWYFDGTAWAQLGGSSSGGGGGISCTTPYDGLTVRYDGASGQWECTDMIKILKGSSRNYASIGNNTSPSPYLSLWIRDRDTITFPPDPTIYYYDNTRVGIGYSPSYSSSYSLSVDGGAHIADGLRVGATDSPPTDGILSKSDIKTTSGNIIVGSNTGAFYHQTSQGVTTTVDYVTGVSVQSGTFCVARSYSAACTHTRATMVTRVTVAERTLTIKGGIITGI